MDNITGSASKWMSDIDIRQQKSTSNELVSEKRKPIDTEHVKTLLEKAKVLYDQTEETYAQFADKNLYDCMVSLKSVIFSIKTINKN